MGRLLVITSGKGGTGKSFCAAGIAFALSKRGKNVILIETDACFPSACTILGTGENAIFDLGDAVKERCSVNEAVINVCKNLRLVPAAQHYGDLDDSDKLQSLLKAFANDSDFCIIDGSSGVGEEFYRSFICGGTAVIVTAADTLSVNAARQVFLHLSDVGASDSLLLVNRFPSSERAVRKKIDIDSILDGVGARLVGIVPHDSGADRLTGGAGLFKNSGSAFERIASRLDGCEVPLPDLRRI